MTLDVFSLSCPPVTTEILSQPSFSGETCDRLDALMHKGADLCHWELHLQSIISALQRQHEEVLESAENIKSVTYASLDDLRCFTKVAEFLSEHCPLNGSVESECHLPGEHTVVVPSERLGVCGPHALGILELPHLPASATCSPLCKSESPDRQETPITTIAEDVLQEHPDYSSEVSKKKNVQQLVHSKSMSLDASNEGLHIKRTVSEKVSLLGIIVPFIIKLARSMVKMLPESMKHGNMDTRIAHLVRSVWFGNLTTIVIVTNVAFIGYSTEYALSHLRNPTTIGMNIVEMFYHVFYLNELAMKLYVFRLLFFYGPERAWNNFDFLLGVKAVYDIYSMMVGLQGVNVSFLRIMRLLKMLKVLKAVRVLGSFRELRLMLVAIVGSLTTFAWCLVMLTCVLFLCSLVFMQAVTGYLERLDDVTLANGADPVAESALRLFGSLPRSIQTMFQAITGGRNWYEISDVLEAAGMFYAVLFCVSIGFLVLAVLNVLTGTFCANAVEAAVRDHDNMAYVAQKESEAFKEEAKKLFKMLDHDFSGSVSWEEFSKNVDNPVLATYLRVLQIDVHDAEFFFSLLAAASNDGEVGVDTFLDGCQRLKGDAKMIDIQMVSCQLKALYVRQEQLSNSMEAHILTLIDEGRSRPNSRLPSKPRIPTPPTINRQVSPTSAAPEVVSTSTGLKRAGTAVDLGLTLLGGSP